MDNTVKTLRRSRGYILIIICALIVGVFPHRVETVENLQTHFMGSSE